MSSSWLDALPCAFFPRLVLPASSSYLFNLNASFLQVRDTGHKNTDKRGLWPHGTPHLGWKDSRITEAPKSMHENIPSQGKTEEGSKADLLWSFRDWVVRRAVFTKRSLFPCVHCPPHPHLRIPYICMPSLQLTDCLGGSGGRALLE